MKVAPFHSKKNPGVYHVCTKCTEGNNIEIQYRTQGTGGGKLYHTCEELIKQGKC